MFHVFWLLKYLLLLIFQALQIPDLKKITLRMIIVFSSRHFFKSKSTFKILNKGKSTSQVLNGF